MKKKKLVVAVLEEFNGPMGQAIEAYRQKQRKKIKFLVERNKKLGPIPDEDLKLVDYPDIQNLDPREWKDQDHYAVLGLGLIRYRATLNQVKTAYRKLVLKHHPDKRRRKGEQISGSDSDDYFSCIQKAFETLKNLESRRSYDSIDPKFDEGVPVVNKHNKDNFFEVFTPVFDLNQRWSVDEMNKIPYLGDNDSTIEEVNEFYTYWYDFQSWREYSYLDEEDKERAEDAMERKWMERKNKQERAAKKKEENARLRSLVDNAYNCDPRIKRFKEEEKRKKEEAKAARAEAIRLAHEKKKAEEEAIKAKEEEEARLKAEELKRQQADAKKKKEREKKAMKKARQKLQNYCKENEYFYTDPQQKLDFMEHLNQLCYSIDILSLNSLNDVVEAASTTEVAQQAICVKLDELKEQMAKERDQHITNSGKSSPSPATNDSTNNKWSYEDLQILIKAVNTFPAGTVNRWKVVANWINSHGSSVRRSPKDCLSRAKNLKESELKAEANQNAFQKFQESHQIVQEKHQAQPKDGEISQRYDAPKAWSSDEQKKLEQALKTYDSKTPERWERIAESVPGRTKRECMLRFKELAQMIKEKRAAAAAAAKK